MSITRQVRRILFPSFVFVFPILLVFFFFKDTILANQLFAFRDLGRFVYPSREYCFQLLRAGSIPLWNPYLYCGEPIFASLQWGVFYPISIVYLFGSFIDMFNNFIYVHFALGFYFMYLLGRQWKFTRTAAIFSATTFCFSAYMISTINVLTFFCSSMWLSLVLLLWERCLGRKSLKYALLTGGALSMMFLAGEPMHVYMASWILFGLAISHTITEKKKTQYWPMAYVKLLSVAGIGFICLSAFQIIPTAELTLLSSRVGMRYEVATTWSMPVYDMLHMVAPGIANIDYVLKNYWLKQSWLMSYYIGLFPVLVLPIYFIAVQDKKKVFLGTLLLAGILLALGRYTPLYKICFFTVPGLQIFRYPVKFFFLTVFSCSLIGGSFLTYYQHNIKHNRHFALVIRRYFYILFFCSIFILLIDRNFAVLTDSVLAKLSLFFERIAEFQDET